MISLFLHSLEILMNYIFVKKKHWYTLTLTLFLLSR